MLFCCAIVIFKVDKSLMFLHIWAQVLSVSNCDRSLSYVYQHFYFNIFSTETIHLILIKLHRNNARGPVLEWYEWFWLVAYVCHRPENVVGPYLSSGKFILNYIGKVLGPIRHCKVRCCGRPSTNTVEKALVGW